MTAVRQPPSNNNAPRTVYMQRPIARGPGGPTHAMGGGEQVAGAGIYINRARRGGFDAEP